MINDIITFLLLVGVILSIPIVANKIDGYIIYKESVYLFENYEYNLQELIEKNNLIKQEPLMSNCFDTNEQIKELAENLTTVYDVQKWILKFPYDYERLSTHCQKATETLKRGKGCCSDDSILVCSIFYEKNISCYSVCGNYDGSHCISLIYYNNFWRPILTTGYINKENIKDFMNSLFLIESKDERYFRNI